MPANPLDRDKRLAYYHAGVGVAGFKLAVEVHRLTIERRNGVDPAPLLSDLSDWCFGKHAALNGGIVVLEDHCTVLLAGLAGQLLNAEAKAGYAYSTMEQRALERGYRSKVARGDDALTDRALVIALAGLHSRDEGDPRKTLRRLWLRAQRLLRQEPNRTRLDRLATRLLEAKELSWPEIMAEIAG